MAAASYNTDLVLLVDSGVTSSFSGIQQTGGGAGVNDPESDYYIQDTECASRNAWAGSWKGIISAGTALSGLSTGVGNAVYTWVTHHTPGSLGTKSVGGIRIVLGSTNSNYNEYYYAGNDTIDYGAPWIAAVIDPDQGLQTTGSVATSAIDFYGGAANLPSGGPTKGAPLGVDIIRFGRSIEVNDGVGAPANFTDLAAQNDAVGNRWGQLQRTPGSATNFTMQCRLEFGDTTNTAACDFRDSNKNITLADLEFVATDFIGFEVTQASTVILENISFLAAANARTRGGWVTTSSTQVDLIGCSFVEMEDFSFDANTTVSTCTFRSTNQITLVQGTSFKNSVVDKSRALDGNSEYALRTPIGNMSANVTGNTFVRDTSNTTPAIFVTGAAANFNLVDTTFTDYAAGTTGTNVANTGTPNGEAIYVAASSGLVQISVDNSTIPSVFSAGAQVNVVSGQATLTVTNVITNSDVVIYTEGTITKLQDDQDIAGTTSTYTYTFSAGTFVDIKVYRDGYVPFFVYGFELGAANTTLPVAQQVDRNYVP
jgi:hypothetical protein